MAEFPLIQGVSPVADLYSQALAALYATEYRILDPDFAQEREPHIWEKIRRDGRILQCIGYRTALVASKSWTVQAGDDDAASIELAQIVTDAIHCIRGFREARRNLAKAIFRGRAYGYIESSRKHKALGSTKTAREWWLPSRIVDIDKRRVQYVAEHSGDGDGRRIRSRTELYSVARNQYETVDPGDPILSVVYDDEESRLGYGRGLLDALYFLWWAKQEVMKEGLQGIARWARGLLVYKVDSNRFAGALGKGPVAVADEAMRTLDRHRGRHTYVIDKDDELTVDSTEGTGQIVQGFIDHINNEILAVAVGSVLPFGGSTDKGSLARSETEKDVADEGIEFDRGVVDEEITFGLIGRFLDYNRDAIYRLGLALATAPRFVTGEADREDHLANVQIIKGAREAGMRIKADEAYEKVGLTRPGPDDELLPDPQPAQPAFGQPSLGGFQ